MKVALNSITLITHISYLGFDILDKRSVAECRNIYPGLPSFLRGKKTMSFGGIWTHEVIDCCSMPSELVVFRRVDCDVCSVLELQTWLVCYSDNSLKQGSGSTIFWFQANQSFLLFLTTACFPEKYKYQMSLVWSIQGWKPDLPHLTPTQTITQHCSMDTWKWSIFFPTACKK